jgi:hypothetical protein
VNQGILKANTDGVSCDNPAADIEVFGLAENTGGLVESHAASVLLETKR